MWCRVDGVEKEPGTGGEAKRWLPLATAGCRWLMLALVSSTLRRLSHRQPVQGRGSGAAINAKLKPIAWTAPHARGDPQLTRPPPAYLYSSMCRRSRVECRNVILQCTCRSPIAATTGYMKIDSKLKYEHLQVSISSNVKCSLESHHADIRPSFNQPYCASS